MRRLRLEMMQRQRRPGFQGLDRDIAAHFLDDRQVEQSLNKELLVVLQVRYDHLQQIIRFPGNEMTGNDLRQSHDGFLEHHRSIVGVTIDLDPDEYGKAETNPVALQCRAVGFDIAVLFKPPNAPQARRCRQADLLANSILLSLPFACNAVMIRQSIASRSHFGISGHPARLVG